MVEWTENYHKPAKGSPVLFSVLFLRFGLAVEKGSSPLYRGPAQRYHAEAKMALAKPHFLRPQVFSHCQRWFRELTSSKYFPENFIFFLEPILKQGEEMMEKFSSCSQDRLITCRGPGVGLDVLVSFYRSLPHTFLVLYKSEF